MHRSGHASLAVVEQASFSRHPDTPNADRLVVGAHVVGVVDGSAPKPWEGAGISGLDVAMTVAESLAATGRADTLAATVERATAAVAALGGALDADAPDRPCATFAVVHLEQRQAWRLGDPTVMVAGEAWSCPRRPDTEAARRRASILRDALERDAEVADLLADDPPGGGHAGRTRPRIVRDPRWLLDPPPPGGRSPLEEVVPAWQSSWDRLPDELAVARAAAGASPDR